VQHLAKDTEARGDAHRLVDDRLHDQIGGLLGRERRHVLVDLGGRDHRRTHQRHVDRRERDAHVDELARRTARPRIERGFGCHVGGEARRVGEHADRRDVDDVTATLSCHQGQNAEREAQCTEVVDRHRPLEIVKPVIGILDCTADRAPGAVDEDVDRAQSGDALFDHLLGNPRRRDVGLHELVAHTLGLDHRPRRAVVIHDAGHEDVRPALGESERECLAEARVAPGDNGVAALQAEEVHGELGDVHGGRS